MDRPPPTIDRPPPTIDPTTLTTDQLLRAISAERDYVEGQLDVLRERLLGIDRATELRLTSLVSHTPEIDQKIAHLAALTEERFESISTQFRERDTRAEREARDNKVAVDAAFAAQKEAAAEQNKSNTLAITKSEIATTETINKLAELFKTTTDALSDKIDDLKERASRMESEKIGRTENQVANHATVSSATAIVGAIFAAIVLGLALYAAFKTGSPTPVEIVTTP